MKNTYYISSWVRRFLQEYLISTRNLSKNTQQSYRDTFRLMLPFIAKRNKKSIENLLIDDMTAEITKDFLGDLETSRHSSLSTRNQRLSMIHAFAKFVGLNSPEHVEWCRQMQMIPFKKTGKILITYLERSEMEVLLNAPDKTTEQGQCDYALLLFLYNTGARADEAAQLLIDDLHIAYTKVSFREACVKNIFNFFFFGVDSVFACFSINRDVFLPLKLLSLGLNPYVVEGSIRSGA